MTEDIRFEYVVYIKASKEKVWEAITHPAIATQYYMCPALEIGSRKGESINYGTAGQVLVGGEIVEFIPHEKLIHTFKFVGSHEDDEKKDDSMVSYELIPEGDLIILVLTHAGFSEKNESYRSITGGWPFVLSNLKTLLETGQTLRQ